MRFVMNYKTRKLLEITLVGWYLLLPLVNSDGNSMVDAPLSRWTQAKAFDSALECQQSLKNVTTYRPSLEEQAGVLAWREQHGRLPLSIEQLTDNVAAARCVSADDPRLR